MFDKIKNLSKTRVKYLSEFENHEWYKWAMNYYDWLFWELEEAKQEYKEDNLVYLEDELWDILWDYLCLLHALEVEWKISSAEKVFERSYKKFSGRIKDTWSNMWDWKEVKAKQNEERIKEHEKLYWKKLNYDKQIKSRFLMKNIKIQKKNNKRGHSR